ncbi:MAG: pyrrolo-quinoline quinone, partial [Candidatus Dormibacteraceae bacterium]
MAEIRCLTNRYDNSRTGANLQETALKPSNVGPTSFGKLFTRPVDGQIYSQPLYAADIQTNRGRLNLLYVATMHNSVYAFEADDPAASAPIWRVSLGPSAPLPDPNIGPSGYRDIAVEVGIVSTPVISPDLKTLYVVAFSKDSSGYHHTLHALDPQTGQQLASQLIKETVPGSGDGSSGGELTFTSHRQLQRAALTLANGRIYIAFAAYGDQTPYHGWVIGCDAQTLKPNSVYVTTPNT